MHVLMAFVVSCTALPKFNHAEPSDFYLGTGTTITIQCHKDYAFLNHKQTMDIYCNSDGDWEPAVQDCQSKL